VITTLSIVFGACLIIGVPIAFALGIAGAAYIVYAEGLSVELLSRRIFYSLNSFPLLAIPLFLIIGDLADRSGMLPRLVEWLRLLVGWSRGGRAYLSVFATLFFSGISGTAVADIASIGRLEIQMMRQAGYSLQFSSALTAASSVMAPIIPPSVAMVIYALSAGNISIVGLFLAGIIPGALIALVLLFLCWYKTRQGDFDTQPFPSVGELVTHTISVLPLLVLPLIIVGGVTGGIFTVTESAAVGTVYVIFLGMIVTRQLTFSDIYKSIIYSAEMSAVLGLIMGTGAIAAWILTRNQAAAELTSFISQFSSDKTVFILLSVVILFILGLFMDATAIIVALAPLLAPVAATFGVDSIHFGLIFVMTVMIGMITPPVGIVLFVTSAVADIKFEQLSRAIVPFVIAEMIVVLAVVFFPSLATWIPRIAGY
jgi:tripartite ATP-independent transporter DctM subunit